MESEILSCDLSQSTKCSEETKPKIVQDNQMTSSLISATSSLASPVDSGVQLLDSESEVTSIMSTSGIGCDFETTTVFCDETRKECSNAFKFEKTVNNMKDEVSNEQSPIIEGSNSMINKVHESEIKHRPAIIDAHIKPKLHIMTKSDIDNHNTTDFDSSSSPAVLNVVSSSNAINPTVASLQLNSLMKYDQKKTNVEKDLADTGFELESVIINDATASPNKSNKCDELMNISLTSYELLDYTKQNSKSPQNNIGVDEMHVSMSEEVNESLKVNTIEPPEKQIQATDDQIVFRRQRRKKSKSDIPKKRVSFHEDILNNTRTDDIHINHGFITHEQDISVSFFERGFTSKPDVIKGRYSWAAEGDAPYYQKKALDRQTKSDIYIHHARVSSTSSSSSASVSSSIDEEDTGNSNSDDPFCIRKEPTQKLPKSSCLKKTRNNKKYIDTNIVQEEVNLKKRKSESNLLDSNIFGSLKNIFNFSTSVPLAERGVPEGQEDVTVYSTSDTNLNRQRKYSGSEFFTLRKLDTYDIQPAPIKKLGNLNVELARTNLKLTKSEGFYPNYPNNQNLPEHIILCDSNVYEHKGISYSYEYEKFQKTFEQQNKPKSSTVYQMLLNELNFFKKKEKKAIEKEAKENVDVLSNYTPIKDSKIEENHDDKSLTDSFRKCSSSTTIDFSDSETNWDFGDNGHTRHLHSPKRKVTRPNHYSVQSMRGDSFEDKSDFDQNLPRSLHSLKQSSSKTSLINRFLRNVTMKKMIDLKLQQNQKSSRRFFSLYVKGVNANKELSRQLDMQIKREIIEAKGKKNSFDVEYDAHLSHRFKNEVFRHFLEDLVGIYPVYSAYTTSGENKPLIIALSNSTLYITGSKPNNSYCNHFVLPYTELNTVLIGPNAQTIHISNYDKDMQCIITTGSELVTNKLIGQMEMIMRRNLTKEKLFAVKQLNMHDMVNLRRAICKQTSVAKEEEYFHYSIINIQDYNSDTHETPLGPSKEGPLMFKTSDGDTRWETAYFILKAGILYMLSSPSHRLPMRVLPLINGACQGARRVYNYARPHTFQVQIGALSLHLAAPDEYVASEWLQALVHAASKTYSQREKMPAQSCSLLMTGNHILTVREAFPCTLTSSINSREQHHPIKGAQAISCAAIADITAFRLPCAEQSWCILEFACREVHESSGDWILYFATNTELEKFISNLEMLWAYHNEQNDSFPLSTIPETDLLSKKCVDTYTMIQNTWLSYQIHPLSF